MLPNAKQESVDLLEELVEKMTPISSLVEEVTVQSAGKTDKAVMDSLLERIFSQLPEAFAVEPLEYKDIQWNCDCSVERLEQVVISIGSKDLKEIIEEDGQAELVCQFCGKKYQFYKEQLEALLAESMQRENQSTNF
jgi:molecular chaperone Hsp33